MAVNLIYTAKSGNQTYWTANNSFSRKGPARQQWSEQSALEQDIPNLMDKFPTVFKNRNRERLAAFDLEKGTITPLKLRVEHPQKDTLPQIYPISLADNKVFAIAIDNASCRFFYNSSGRDGSLVSTINQTVKRWNDQRKAEVTAANVQNNQRLWKKYPDLDPAQLTVIDLSTGLTVWPRVTDHGANPKAANFDTKLVQHLVMRLHTQLSDHFDPTVNNLPVSRQVGSDPLPTVDFTEYNAQKVFDALAYLALALTKKEQVDQLLAQYDGDILQDYLHTVEIVDISQLDTDKFVEHLHQVRLKRRRVKDLAILLGALADNFAPEKILKALWGNPSLKNQYYIRNQKVGDDLLEMIQN
jgi:hypothetical protein